MQVLTNKRVLLGVTGSIAAYKAADLVRRLREAGADVRVVMTRGATEFVRPMTFQALSGKPVHRHLLDTEAEAGMGHIELARWADVILVAPASADFLARLAQGRADDLLAAVCLAGGKVPLAVAPAMNAQMWASPASQENVRLLGSRGVLILGPEEGKQACGEVGAGRLLAAAAIISQLAELFAPGSLSGKTLLISAGPTREAIDPVRYLSNHSSGKMGFSVAAAASEAGAKVILVTGPVALATPDRVERIDVISAMEMHDVILEHASAADIFIATAAVADYRPAQVENEKLKKDDSRLTLELLPNPDILATVKAQFSQLFCVGFAAETQNLQDYAQQKLHKKGIEMVAANWVGPAAKATGGTFGSDDNALHLFWRGGELELEQASKDKLARQLIGIVAQRYALHLATVEGTGKEHDSDPNKVINIKR